jgi:uncharacterized protein (DUF2062 family)
MLRHLRRLLPSRERIQGNRWLAWLGPHLLHPRLWHFSRRGVAIGVALGVFFGLLIPIAQIPFAAGMAVLLRANVPAAVGSTLVTNPVTFAPVYLLAHRLGAVLLGETDTPMPDLDQPEPVEIDADAGWWPSVWKGILALGKPLLLGLSILAVAAGLLTYSLIMLFWRLRTTWQWKRRRKRAGNEP